MLAIGNLMMAMMGSRYAILDSITSRTSKPIQRMYRTLAMERNKAKFASSENSLADDYCQKDKWIPEKSLVQQQITEQTSIPTIEAFAKTLASRQLEALSRD